MGRPLARAVAALAAAALTHARLPQAASLEDAAALVQASKRSQAGARAGTLFVSNAVAESGKDPMVYTPKGAMEGVFEGDCSIFKKVPYASKPGRFEKAEPVSAWPKTLRATKFGPGCIGSHTDVQESEDCLFLNIWVPRGEHKELPVLVYFHGGMNQHGSGQESLRQGDGVCKSEQFPTIFINFDFRLGIFGWIAGDNLNVPKNLGFMDQQMALRWVQDNIRAFGGDPNRVTLQGQSEGSNVIMNHLVSPGSAGLFHRAIFHSPPAEVWSQNANKERTQFMINRLKCNNAVDVVDCLKGVAAQRLWAMDWVGEELTRRPGQHRWITNFVGLLKFWRNKAPSELVGDFGWHPIPDGYNVPGDARELIAQGRWHNNVPVLVTTSKNESWGVFPGGSMTHEAIKFGIETLSEKGSHEELIRRYQDSLYKQGIVVHKWVDLLHMVISDKMWMCDIRSLASDMVATGGKAYLGMFWHSPKVDPVGRLTNPECQTGATCHAAEMLYALPQGRGIGVEDNGDAQEKAFMRSYRDAILSFVYGQDDKDKWVQYDNSVEPMMFWDTKEHGVQNHYRKEQCDILDTSMGEVFPLFMRQRAQELRSTGARSQLPAQPPTATWREGVPAPKVQAEVPAPDSALEKHAAASSQNSTVTYPAGTAPNATLAAHPATNATQAADKVSKKPKPKQTKPAKDAAASKDKFQGLAGP